MSSAIKVSSSRQRAAGGPARGNLKVGRRANCAAVGGAKSPPETALETAQIAPGKIPPETMLETEQNARRCWRGTIGAKSRLETALENAQVAPLLAGQYPARNRAVNRENCG